MSGWQTGFVEGTGIYGASTGSDLDFSGDPRQAAVKAIQTVSDIGTGIAGSITGGDPISSGIGIGVGLVCNAISNGIDAYDTQKTVAALRKLSKEKLPRVSGQERDDLEFVIELAWKKKNRHVGIAVGSAIPVGSIGVSIYRGIRGAHKKRTGTKGVSRKQAADILLEYKNKPGPAGDIAREIIVIVAGRNFEDLMKKSIANALKS